MPRPFPQREPTPDEQTPAQRVLAVYDALGRAKADAARLADAEGALAELLAGEAVGEPVDPDTLDQAKADAARCQQARGLVAGLRRRLIAALEVYRSDEHARLRARLDKRDEEERHQRAAMDALNAQLQEASQRYIQAKTAADQARSTWASMPHLRFVQLLAQVIGRERPDQSEDLAGWPDLTDERTARHQVIGAGEAYDVAG